jgi:hypothetical protein
VRTFCTKIELLGGRECLYAHIRGFPREHPPKHREILSIFSVKMPVGEGEKLFLFICKRTQGTTQGLREVLNTG